MRMIAKTRKKAIAIADENDGREASVESDAEGEVTVGAAASAEASGTQYGDSESSNPWAGPFPCLPEVANQAPSLTKN